MTYYSRKPTRIPGFNYASENYYFITICTHEKKCIFGKPQKLNTLGRIAYEDMQNIASHLKGVHIDNFIIMPNHVHAIVVLTGEDTLGLEKIIGLYKSGVSRRIRKENPQMCVWQRSFHDHIIRNRQEYEKIWTYIQYNDKRWESDCFYTDTEGT